MHEPLVSIVVINYNYGRFLARALTSALQQDWARLEVVVVDDCSTDDSRAVIAEFQGRVVEVLQPSNRGHGAAINAGFAACAGDVVLFLDADDYLYPHAARDVGEALAADEMVAQYQYRLDLVDADGKVIDAYPPLDAAWAEGDVRGGLLTSGRYATTVTSGLAFSRKALEAILPMDESAFSQGGDGYLVTVAPLYGAVKTLPGLLGAYCQHGANHSQFGEAVAGRARWRLAHDEMRLTALARHADKQGLSLQPELWRNDPLHLEERAASLLLEPSAHPHPTETRQSITRSALAARRALPVSGIRQAAMGIWWILVGFGPLPMARTAIRWKLQASTRPSWVRLLAKAARRAAAIDGQPGGNRQRT